MGNGAAVPKDWAECALPEMCRMVMGQSPPSSTYNTEGRGLPFFQGKKEFGERYPRAEVWCDAPNKIAEAESVLMSIRAPVGPTNIARERSCIGRGLAALHPYEGVDRDYLLYLLRRHERSLSGQGAGSTFDAVTKAFLERYRVHLAPLVEQRAIVAKIESLFSELDQGVAQLQAVRTQLGRYRQSVLKAAFEGRLTAAWREQRQREAEANGEPLSTADDLLARIRAERQAAHAARLAEWEHAVAAWEEAGGKASGTKKPRKPAAPKDPPPLTKEELADLPELPEGWVQIRLGAFADITGGVTKGRKLEGRDVVELPYLRVANVQDGYLDLDVMKQIAIPVEEVEKYRLQPGDVLYTEGGDRDKLGRGTVWRGEISDCIHQNHIFRARPVSIVAPRFLSQFSQTQPARTYFFRHARQTVNLASINLGLLSSLPVPIPPPDEQSEIINEIDARLSVVDQVERTIAAALKQAEALRQSILKKAFEGRLLSEAELAAVRADPAYEPADALLARIRGEAADQPKRAASKVSRSEAAGVSIPKGERYRQAACAAYAVRRLASQPTFGRVQQMKYLYLVPHIVEQESHIHAERQAAGPLDPAIHKIESLAKKQNWFTVKKSGQRYIYTPGARIDEACTTAVEVFGPGKAKVDWLLDQFAKFDTERAELVATTFAVWNDLLIDGEEPTEAAIVAGVHGWHPDKAAKFPADRIGRCIKWLRDNNLVPTGTGPRTQMAEAGA